MTEEWRPIPGHELYDASSLGRIRSWAVRGWPNRRAHAPSIRSLCKENDGHLSSTLGRTGRHVGVHSLIALTFYGPRGPGQVCRHLNGIPHDNRVDNLAWGTPRENGQDAKAHGALPHGTDHGAAKLNDAAVRLIRTRKESVSSLSRRFGVSRAAIRNAQIGKTWTHVHELNDAARLQNSGETGGFFMANPVDEVARLAWSTITGTARVRHGFSVDRPICALETPISKIGAAVSHAFGNVDCPDCLRRALAEVEERGRVLRELLAKVEAHA